MSTEISKPSFNSAYLELISLSENAPADSFYSTSDYAKLSSLGPSLPKIKIPLPRASTESTNDGAGAKAGAATSSVSLTFKSIKPPFKFNTQLNNVPNTVTVFKIKNDLIDSLPILKDAGVESSDLKLLVKGKVIQDTAVLSNVTDESEVSFMCMVSAPKPKDATVEAESDPMDVDPTTPSANSKPVISKSAWDKIEAVLVEDIGAAQATAVLTTLKSSLN